MFRMRFGVALSFIGILLVSIAFVLTANRAGAAQVSLEETQSEQWELPELPSEMVDYEELYTQFDDTGVEKVYITVLPEEPGVSVSFRELHDKVNLTNDVYYNDSQDPFVNIYWSTSPEEISSKEAPNGTLEIRGQSSRRMPQKSYKINLLEETMPWHSFKTINLNKHFSDLLRIRNKLSFDYFKLIPDMVSYRTKFVQVYIKDLSEGEGNQSFESYGLFTFIEQPNKSFLKAHGLDPSGHLYKAEFFEFFRYEEAIKTKEDPEYSYEKFEAILETRGNEDHMELIQMLEAVNDYSLNINDVVENYFDKENMLTWLACNILMNNYDTSSRNFLIYSPLNSSKWYFVPWDYDSTWTVVAKSDEAWEFGLANYWGMVLFNRYFRYPENVQALSNKIEELSTIITSEQTNEFVEEYINNTLEILYSLPDQAHMRLSKGAYLEQVKNLAGFPQYNKERYYRDIERPMPFFLWEYTQEEDGLHFGWDASFDLQGDEITYEIAISDRPTFESVIYHEEGLLLPSATIPRLPAGTYYWKVVARDSEGNWRNSFDSYTEEGTKYEGVLPFQVQ